MDDPDDLATPDEFRDRWVAELREVRTPRDAAALPTTGKAALRAWRQFTAGAGLVVAGLRARTAVAVDDARRILREFAPVAGRALLAVAQVAAVSYAEHLDEVYRQHDAALRSRGWWALASWTDEQLETFAAIASSRGRQSLDRAICDAYRAGGAKQLRAMFRRWESEPEFRLRRPILRDALSDHLDGRYRVSVPTLLPHVEGIIAGAFDLGRRVQVTESMAPLAELRSGLESLEIEVALASLGTLYAPVDFSITSPLSNRLSRHAILHGRIVRYGTEVNSMKLFAYLDQAHSQVATKRRLEEGRSRPLESRPILVAHGLVQSLGAPDELLEAARSMPYPARAPRGRRRIVSALPREESWTL